MDPLTVKRRLTCILAADAVGYSQQMGQDEENTIRVLSAHRAVIDGIITFHGGRVISTAGDSVLAEFSSVVEAVRCAVEIQEALKTRNDALPDKSKMYFRVGVNLGDVVVKNDDLLGDGVNVAARLEPLAEIRSPASSIWVFRISASRPSRTSRGRYACIACPASQRRNDRRLRYRRSARANP